MTVQERERLASVDQLALAILAQHPEWPLWLCLYVAEEEDRLMYGTRSVQPPRGLLGEQP